MQKKFFSGKNECAMRSSSLPPFTFASRQPGNAFPAHCTSRSTPTARFPLDFQESPARAEKALPQIGASNPAEAAVPHHIGANNSS